MPKLSAQELINPTTDPFVYPGVPVNGDALICGNWLYRMSARQGMRVGSYEVALDGGPLSADYAQPLGEVLLQAGATPIGDRYPVVAVGSNASAGQLAHKFREAWESTVIPITSAYITGLGVGYSAHVNRAGYMPFTPCRTQPNGRHLAILWLDSDQLSRMNETEPNYHPATLADDQFGAVLDSREPLSSFVIYRSRWGVFRDDVNRSPIAAASQESAFRTLATLEWFSRLVPEAADGPREAISALVADEGRRDAVRQLLADHGHAAPDGLPPVVFNPATYDGGSGAVAWGVAGACG
jgi:hypothetical protein